MRYKYIEIEVLMFLPPPGFANHYDSAKADEILYLVMGLGSQ